MRGTVHKVQIGLGIIALVILWACSGGGGGGGAGGTGSLRVEGTPPGAQVFLNNQPRGTAPLELTDLPAGTYTVRVEFAEDGQIVAQEFQVRVGAQSVVRYDLNQYRIEAIPASIEVWVGTQQQVSAVVRDSAGNRLAASFRFSIVDNTFATIVGTTETSCTLQGLRMGSTYLEIKDANRGVSLRVPVSVLDFPPPPGG